MKWYIKVLQNYANFSGRARRKEYWMFVLFNIIFACVAVVLDNLLGIAFAELGYGPIYLVYLLAMLVPGIAVAVRRLHDIGKSGWSFLISFIPIVSIVLLVWFCKEGEPGENQYGLDPKSEEVL